MEREALALTALVTGASSGIGRAFAEVLARNGFDLILTARREEELQALALRLQESYPIRATVLPADLADPTTPARLSEAIASRGLRVDALVNNAGFAVEGSYRYTRWQNQRDLLQVMVIAPCELTQRWLPDMVARRKGYIINVASIGGLILGSAGTTLYGPAKSFLIQFSRCLHLEQEGSGVHVTAICPGLTRTEFHDVEGIRAKISRVPAFMWLTPEEVAEAGYAAALANQPVRIIGWVNHVYALLGKYVPDTVLMRLQRPLYADYRA